MQDLKEAINKLANGQSLSREDTKAAFNIIMSGEATDAQIGGILMAMRVRGETEDEFAGAIDALRAVMLPVDAPLDAIDIVGTGGDAKGSYNISTCTAIVTASCGVPVAKHGNRSLSSKSGCVILPALNVSSWVCLHRNGCLQRQRLRKNWAQKSYGLFTAKDLMK